MSKVIVLSGHGEWELKDKDFTTLPAKCTMKFYTMNAKALSDGLGGDIDRGLVNGLDPDQVVGPYKNVTDVTLFPPDGLDIKTPPSGWSTINLPHDTVPTSGNIQVCISDTCLGGLSLSEIFSRLEPAITNSNEVTILWAACRIVNLNETDRGIDAGVNEVQR